MDEGELFRGSPSEYDVETGPDQLAAPILYLFYFSLGNRAEQLHHMLLETQDLHEEHRDRLQHELGLIDGVWLEMPNPIGLPTRAEQYRIKARECTEQANRSQD